MSMAAVMFRCFVLEAGLAPIFMGTSLSDLVNVITHIITHIHQKHA